MLWVARAHPWDRDGMDRRLLPQWGRPGRCSARSYSASLHEKGSIQLWRRCREASHVDVSGQLSSCKCAIECVMCVTKMHVIRKICERFLECVLVVRRGDGVSGRLLNSLLLPHTYWRSPAGIEFLEEPGGVQSLAVLAGHWGARRGPEPRRARGPRGARRGPEPRRARGPLRILRETIVGFCAKNQQ